MIFWLSLPAVSVYRTDVEHLPLRRGFVAPNLAAHAGALEASVLAARHDVSNGGPFHLLDSMALSKACGSWCARDGKHYLGVVEEAHIQVLANVYARSLPEGARNRGACRKSWRRPESFRFPDSTCGQRYSIGCALTMG
jgi:hypothetical protein